MFSQKSCGSSWCFFAKWVAVMTKISKDNHCKLHHIKQHLIVWVLLVNVWWWIIQSIHFMSGFTFFTHLCVLCHCLQHIHTFQTFSRMKNGLWQLLEVTSKAKYVHGCILHCCKSLSQTQRGWVFQQLSLAFVSQVVTEETSSRVLLHTLQSVLLTW